MNKSNSKQTAVSPGRRVGQILDLLSSRGFSSVSELAERFNVSEMTIRRDLDKLEAAGSIRRTHGGAMPEGRNQIELGYLARQKRQSDEKERIGKLAAGLVRAGQSIFIDAGTTTLSMVKYLKAIKDLRIVTTSLPIQMEMLDCANVKVIMVGGEVLAHIMSLVGPIAQETISKMRFDISFLGTGGIDIERGLTHSSIEEIPIKKTAAAAASKVAVLADNTKFGYNALALFMGIEEVDIIITDQAAESAAEQIKTNNHKTRIIWP